MLLPAVFSQPTPHASTAAATISASPAPLQIVDTNISLFRWPFRRLPLDDTQELCATLRSLGVVRAIAGSFEGLFQRDLTGVNRRLAEECARHSELLPVGSVNPSKPGWQSDFDLCREELGMSGIRLHPGFHGYSLEHPGFRSLLERAAAAGMFVQVVATVEDRRTQPDLFRTADVDLSPLVDSCRGLDSLHLQVLNARPTTALAVRLCEVPGLCFDTARIEGTDGVPRLVQSLPAGRVIFGSHAPFLIPEAALIRVHESGLLSENQLRSIYESGLDCLRGSAP
ncbi:MAG: amidohydrolase family protein [Planctomycetaceae bacterium]